MNLSDYKNLKLKREQEKQVLRERCTSCLQPEFSCYCPQVHKFNPQIEFVILIHKIEFKRRIATGRMSHLCLENSHLILGHDYTHCDRVNALIQDSERHCVMLYPGASSVNLTGVEPIERERMFLTSKKLTVFVIDGTWATAKKMVHLSQNLKTLPRVCFTPTKPSNFRVRKQPTPTCYSTIEAIHHTIELLGPTQGFSIQTREHDKLLIAFDHMVERQLLKIHSGHELRTTSTYRRPLAAAFENK